MSELEQFDQKTYEDAIVAALVWIQSLPQQELGIMTLRKAFELGFRQGRM